MTDDAEGSALKGIAALPPTTVRQIGSHQLLTDPSLVVKELIDNALDARAKSIFVDLTANTIDSIQVRDDGHSISNEDRALACRRYHTSKIRDFHDLKEVGDKWLGFRGEALASVVDMSGPVSITTRVEGEPVAVKLTYQRNGELTSTVRDSHPVGTTVKVTKLLETARVRKDLAIKGAPKCLAKIRRLMQAYALARPAIWFILHVLKAKNNKCDFVYAPKASANVEDAALKIIGKECALQCDWTALQLDGFELHAFMPKSTAAGSKIANHGAFISVDSRPVSSTRGTLKKIAAAVRDRLRKANLTLTNPAKDDVVFGDEKFVLSTVGRLLVSYYPENINSAEPTEDPEDMAISKPDQKPEVTEQSPQHSSQPPGWRSSMYGIDEEDLEFLQEHVPDIVEEEEGRRDTAISNPLTIARMNAPIKPRKPVGNGQLLSPAKSQRETTTDPQSSVPAAMPQQSRLTEPLSPRTPSQVNIDSIRLDEELQQSIQHFTELPFPGPSTRVFNTGPRTHRARDLPSFEERMLDWDGDSTDTVDAFATAIDERRIMQWVMVVDDLLAEVFDRRDVEVRGALHEGIQRLLDLRKDEAETAPESAAVAVAVVVADTPVPDVVGRITGVSSVGGEGEGSVAAGNSVAETDGLEADLDFTPLVNLDRDEGGRGVSGQVVGTGDAFGDGGEDEMLMDL
ncbi:uncharacterized protein M421DRAFT_98318 [Didymella exigua CBS 183.55]|uniref:DNA mismatch repair protein S5 domain-containing protein n=1 Tax=Didymella exigua CBS 183.55 TaxID=1150837 RepID=A0A6A5RXM4_9PLEO|nr:uncharacterized protein M421DRAFT_98318 [Didymella exigua CBS 183.55]KAF1932100.1 hypothetical protein M421DRAFT_98318 [Didymella exigua CBS 183.55]